MLRPYRLLLFPLLPALVAACNAGAVDAGRLVQDPLSLVDPHPGLPAQPTVAPPSTAAAAPVVVPASVPSLPSLPGTAPELADDNALPFPAVAGVTGADAARMLAGDPLALRFLAIRQLLDAGLITSAEASARVAANKGALLPLTAPHPPSIGLARPLPSIAAIIARFRALAALRPGSDKERAFLLDAILPASPTARQYLSPPDKVSARQELARLDRLQRTGLIGLDQGFREQRAVDALIDSGRLPEKLIPAPPPATNLASARPKPRHPYRGFEPAIAPSPPGMDPPELRKGEAGPAGAVLMSLASSALSDKAWAASAQQNPELGALPHKIVKVDLGELGVTYRLIAGPMKPAAAETLCKSLRSRGQDCTPTPFPP